MHDKPLLRRCLLSLWLWASLASIAAAGQTMMHSPYAEHPATMMEAPIIRDALPVMKAIPAVWDETIVLAGSGIGDLAAFARRSGEGWLVSILNGSGQRTYELDLRFLPQGDYEATLVRDDLGAESVNLAEVGVNIKADHKQWTTTVPFKVSTEFVHRPQTMPVRLAEGGGFAARLIKKP